MKAAVTEKWKERAAAARQGHGILEPDTRKFESVVRGHAPRIDFGKDYEKCAADIYEKFAAAELMADVQKQDK